MSEPITFLNGEYVPHSKAFVHVEDRGFLFADGIYDFVLVHRGRLINEEAHLDRIHYSLGELEIAWPLSRDELKAALREVIRRNDLVEGYVYIEMTRGVAPRDHAFPKDVKGTVVIIARHAPYPSDSVARQGVKVITTPDLRWKRCDIKSVALLPNVLARQRAIRAGASEAWMIDDEGFVTEGCACNAWIVTDAGHVVTRYLDRAILSGITRRMLTEVLAKEGVRLEERKFTVAEAQSAREAFLTNTPLHIKPVIQIDDRVVGTGEAGPLTLKILASYRAFVAAQANQA